MPQWQGTRISNFDSGALSYDERARLQGKKNFDNESSQLREKWENMRLTCNLTPIQTPSFHPLAGVGAAARRLRASPATSTLGTWCTEVRGNTVRGTSIRGLGDVGAAARRLRGTGNTPQVECNHGLCCIALAGGGLPAGGEKNLEKKPIKINRVPGDICVEAALAGRRYMVSTSSSALLGASAACCRGAHRKSNATVSYKLHCGHGLGFAGRRYMVQGESEHKNFQVQRSRPQGKEKKRKENEPSQLRENVGELTCNLTLIQTPSFNPLGGVGAAARRLQTSPATPILGTRCTEVVGGHLPAGGKNI
ncbi:hypothetical protein DFH06DRAFT_1123671 [Mycena polygramma]|nr:hypothetical protein DFH06DRAFT_1123671 [Mycena polygramma]